MITIYICYLLFFFDIVYLKCKVEGSVMKKEVLNRKSNYELMRITSMIFIVIYHIIMHCCFESKSTGSMSIIINFINALIVVHVNSFILLTGYFQCKTKLKLSRVISLNNAAWFYKALFLLIVIILSTCLGIKLANHITTIEFIKTILPIDYGIYWFLECYLAIYLLSPILNKVILNCTKKQLQKIIIIIFILFSIISTLTMDEVIYTRSGHSIASFILLYFIGAYLRLYPMNENYFFKIFTDTAKKTIYLIAFLSCACLSLLCHIAYTKMSGLHPLFNEIGLILNYSFFSFASPIVIIQSIFYFLFFSTLNINSKFINKISKSTFGVYLIHENIYVRDNIYKWLGYTKINIITPKVVIITIITAIVMFLVCTVMEQIRQKIFNFIYNRKFSKRIRKKYQEYFKNLGLNLTW